MFVLFLFGSHFTFYFISQFHSRVILFPPELHSLETPLSRLLVIYSVHFVYLKMYFFHSQFWKIFFFLVSKVLGWSLFSLYFVKIQFRIKKKNVLCCHLFIVTWALTPTADYFLCPYMPAMQLYSLTVYFSLGSFLVANGQGISLIFIWVRQCHKRHV